MKKEDLNIKQLLIVRKDLNMRSGKIAAQCAHASCGIMFNHSAKTTMNTETNTYSTELEDMSSEMNWWINNGTKKICVYVESEEDLLELKRLSGEFNLPNYLVVDSGFTEFKNKKTNTVLAIGPAEGQVIDILTKNLKLM